MAIVSVTEKIQKAVEDGNIIFLILAKLLIQLTTKPK